MYSPSGPTVALKPTPVLRICASNLDLRAAALCDLAAIQHGELRSSLAEVDVQAGQDRAAHGQADRV